MSIAGIEAEEMLREYKKEAQALVKHQSGTRRIVAKGGGLRRGEAAEKIRDRCEEEVEHAKHTAQLKGKRGERRKAFARQLDVLAALDDPNRLNLRSERATSV